MEVKYSSVTQAHKEEQILSISDAASLFAVHSMFFGIVKRRDTDCYVLNENSQFWPPLHMPWAQNTSELYAFGLRC